MALNQNQPGYLKPVFLNKDRQRAYDAANTGALTKMAGVPPPKSYYSQEAEASKFSNLLSSLRSPGQSNAVANSTPQMSGNVSPDISKLGTQTTGWGESTRYEKFHPAVDIANKPDTPIPSFIQGTVTSVVTGKKQGDNGYGNYVIVTDAQGNKHRYSHLHQAYVKVGQKVGSGQQLGTMGNSGSTYSPSGKGTGTHLDYRIVNAYNKYVNPYTYLKNFT